MPGVGFEPTRPCGQRILSPPSLPFLHPGGRLPKGTSGRPGHRTTAIVVHATLDLGLPVLAEAEHREGDEHDLHAEDHEGDQAQERLGQRGLLEPDVCRG